MHGLKDATLDTAIIERWWKGWPEANVGVATGPSRLAVLDIDPRHGGDESLRDLTQKHGDAWLETAIALTGGGGTHYLFKQNEERPARNAADVFPGIDVRGEGGYIVAPPSLHQSGKPYAWERTANEVELLPWPTDIIRVSRQRHEAPIVGEVISHGSRNEILTSLAGSMRRRGMSEEAIFAALQAENSERCDPPLPIIDIRKIARSVARYEPSNDILLRVKVGTPTYSLLRKQDTDPPVYVLRVNETDVRLTTAALLDHKGLRKLAYEQANVLLPHMSGKEWDDQLATLTSEMEVLDAPDDASELGMIWSVVKEVLVVRSDDEERFDQGKPLESDGYVFVTGAMLRESLRAHGLTPEARRIWEAVRGHGAENRVTRIQGKVRRVWAIPLEVLE